MLAFNPFLMAEMQTPHLVAALESEGFTTPAERELCFRLGDLAAQESPEDVEARLERTYEIAMEQSEFRAALIDQILTLCESPGTKAGLVAAIKTALENSYVEL